MCVGSLGGVTYLRYTVLTRPKKDETAVHCCDPALSVLVMLYLPSRAAVVLTHTVCSLLLVSCLFSRFRRCFFTLAFRPAHLQASESDLKSIGMSLHRLLPPSVPSLSGQLLHRSLGILVGDNAVFLVRPLLWDAR